MAILGLLYIIGAGIVIGKLMSAAHEKLSDERIARKYGKKA